MAEIIQIKFKVDGKEITATEQDLKDLQKATADVEKTSGGASKGIDKMGLALKALGAVAAAGAMAKFVVETVSAVKEVENLARVAGVGVEAFQRQAFAAKSVGIETEKLADIYKDVNDKLGDFVQTGAGPLADFFDGIGKQMGVTIDDFKELSSDQALGLYVKTLEDANVSQQEMTFFLEAIASDATLLAPLLADNGKKMKEFGDAAGGVLSEETIRKASELDGMFKSMANTIGVQLKSATIGATHALAEFFGLTDMGEARNSIGAAREELKKLQEDFTRANKTRVGGKSPNSFLPGGVGVGAGEATAEQQKERMTKILELQKQIATWEDVISGKAAERAAAQAKADAEKLAADAATAAATAKGEAEREAAAAKQAVADAALLKAREAEMEALANLADPMKQYTDKLERIQVLMEENKNNPEVLAVLSGAYLNVATAASAAADQAERVNDASGDETEAEKIQRLAEKWNTVKQEAKEHAADVAELRELYVAGEISADELRAKVAEIGKTEDGEKTVFQLMAEELAGLDHGIQKMTTESIVDMAGQFAQMAVDGEKSFEEMAKAMLKQIAKLIVQTLILRALQSFMGGGADAGPAVDFQGRPITMDSGGQGSVGNAFLIGTGAQPELFVPQTSGQFIPKQQILAGMNAGGGGVTIGSINVVVKEDQNETSAEQANKISKAISRDMRQLVQQELTQQSRAGNILNPVPQSAFR
jgi:hypothetical protein